MNSSYGGGLPVRELEARTRIIDRLAGLFCRSSRPRGHRAQRPRAGRTAGVWPRAGLRGPQRPQPPTGPAGSAL